MKRVVVTGIGIVSSIGNNYAEVKESLFSSKSGITFQPEYAERGLRSNVAGALNIKTVDATTITSGKEFHLQSSANYLSAIKVGDSSGNTEINSAGNHHETASAIHMNGPAAVAATPYGGLTAKVDTDGNLFFTNTLYTRNSEDKRNTERVGTILTRFPTREPFARQEYTD